MQENNQRRHGVLKRRYRSNPEVDYFPMRACPEVVYPSDNTASLPVITNALIIYYMTLKKKQKKPICL